MSELEMIAIGDSVAWGQALSHDQKFCSQFFHRMTGRRWPESDLVAHSGAIIGLQSDPEDDPCTTVLPTIEDGTGRGEVPCSVPTIASQLQSVPVDRARDIDVVVLNGGINDIGFANILNPTTSRSEIERDVERYCYEDTKAILQRSRTRYPNAVIFVLGYYPILSTRSDLDTILAYVLLQGGGLAIVGVAGIAAVRLAAKQVIRNAIYFHLRQLYWLRKAVTEANSAGDHEIFFVSPGFSEQNSIAADDPFLFSPASPPNLSEWFRWVERNPVAAVAGIEPDDELSEVRKSACDRVYGTGFSRAKCRVAALGHPNERGARRYAERMSERYRSHQRAPFRRHLSKLLDDTTRGDGLSVRTSLERYNLSPKAGVRAALQQTAVDSIQVTIRTADERSAGTHDDVYLDVGNRQWLLNEGLFDLDLHNDFERGATDTYTIDPALEASHSHFHLGDIHELTLWKRSTGGLSPDWKPAAIRIDVNGRTVYDERIDTEFTGERPSWTASAPRFPARIS